MAKIKYRALSDLECSALYHIWLIQERVGVQKATRDRLARWLKISPSYLAKVLSKITKISEHCYIKSHRLHGREDRRQPGPPRVYYELIGERFVTFPETAHILLALLTSPNQLSRRVNYLEFVNSMTSSALMDKSYVESRIQFAIENDYIGTEDEGTHIAALDRAVHERPYLERLAANFAANAHD